MSTLTNTLAREFNPILKKLNSFPPGEDKIRAAHHLFQGLINRGTDLTQWPYFLSLIIAKLEVFSIDPLLSDYDRLMFNDYRLQFFRLLGGKLGEDFQISFKVNHRKLNILLTEYNVLHRFAGMSNLPVINDEPLELLVYYRNQSLVGLAILRRFVNYNLVLNLILSQCKDKRLLVELEKQIILSLRRIPGQLFFADRSALVRSF